MNSVAAENNDFTMQELANLMGQNMTVVNEIAGQVGNLAERFVVMEKSMNSFKTDMAQMNGLATRFDIMEDSVKDVRKDIVDLKENEEITYSQQQYISMAVTARVRHLLDVPAKESEWTTEDAVTSYGRTKAITHGKSKTRLYRIWIGMKRRCYNADTRGFSRYGGRGITICKEWLESFECFHEWAAHNGYSDEKSIDRIDNNGNYEPNNCRWATPKEQCNNRDSNIIYEYKGEKHTLAEIATLSGISREVLKQRTNKGMSIEESVNTPIDLRFSHKGERRRNGTKSYLI